MSDCMGTWMVKLMHGQTLAKGRALGRVYKLRSGFMQTMHLLPGVAIQPNLELKTRPKPVLGSLLLAFALPGLCYMGH